MAIKKEISEKSSEKKVNVKKMAIAAIFVALAVVGSTLSVPAFGSKCAPVQHLINVLCAVFLGPVYGIIVAFLASLIRNFVGLGTVLAFPGSMCGALVAGFVYHFTKKLKIAEILTCAGEVIGTGIIGGMLAYPIAALIMNNSQAALFTFVVPFLISTVGGSIIAFIVLMTMKQAKILKKFQDEINR